VRAVQQTIYAEYGCNGCFGTYQYLNITYGHNFFPLERADNITV
jgi:hypothetical protein